MNFSDAERQAIASRCTRFLGSRPALSFAERMCEIAESEFAKLPLDHYGNGGFVAQFELELAEMMGMEAAVFMPSGTMAQQIALRVWCDRAGSPRVAFHPTSHLEIHEQGAYRILHHLESELVGERHGLLTLADLEHLKNKPAALLIELPQREIGGQLPSWTELTDIAGWARANGVKLHMDGARFWECGPYYGRDYREIAGLFDSVYVSFYKVLGGLPGAMLFGPADFITESRIWQRRHGGNLHTLAPNAIAGKIGLDRELPRIPDYVARAGEIADAIRGIDGLTVVPDHPPTNMMHWHWAGDKERIEQALYEAAKETGVLLFRWLSPTDRPDVWMVEVSISGRGMEIEVAEIRRILENISEKR